MARHGTAGLGRARQGTRPGAARLGAAWLGMARQGTGHGAARQGMARHGWAWQGEARNKGEKLTAWNRQHKSNYEVFL